MNNYYITIEKTVNFTTTSGRMHKASLTEYSVYLWKQGYLTPIKLARITKINSHNYRITMTIAGRHYARTANEYKVESFERAVADIQYNFKYQDELEEIWEIQESGCGFEEFK